MGTEACICKEMGVSMDTLLVMLAIRNLYITKKKLECYPALYTGDPTPEELDAFVVELENETP